MINNLVDENQKLSKIQVHRAQSDVFKLQKTKQIIIRATEQENICIILVVNEVNEENGE